MADNVGYTPGTGATIAADDISGVLVQRVKSTFGVDGVSTDVSQNAGLPMASASLIITGTPVTTLNGDLLPSTDVSGYRRFSVQITGTWSATVTWQGSNDNTNWTAIFADYLGSNTNVSVPSVTFTGVIAGNINFRYLRIRATAFTSGTITGTIELSALPYGPQTIAVAQPGAGYTGTVKTAFADNTNYVNVVGLPASQLFGDATSSATVNTVTVAAAALVYNGTTLLTRLRTPIVFKTATATASGDTGVWTPTSGKKFRVMKYSIEVTGDAATSGGAVIDIVLRDATTAIGVGASVFVPLAGGTVFSAGYSTGWIDLGNGYISTATNAVLNVNLSATLTGGKVRVVVAGTEE